MGNTEKRPETLRAALIEAIFYGKDRLCYVAIIIALLSLAPHALDGVVDVIEAFVPDSIAASAEDKK